LHFFAIVIDVMF